MSRENGALRLVQKLIQRVNIIWFVLKKKCNGYDFVKFKTIILLKWYFVTTFCYKTHYNITDYFLRPPPLFPNCVFKICQYTNFAPCRHLRCLSNFFFKQRLYWIFITLNDFQKFTLQVLQNKSCKHALLVLLFRRRKEGGGK